jgi:hypothetical protein
MAIGIYFAPCFLLVEVVSSLLLGEILYVFVVQLVGLVISLSSSRLISCDYISTWCFHFPFNSVGLPLLLCPKTHIPIPTSRVLVGALGLLLLSYILLPYI